MNCFPCFRSHKSMKSRSNKFHDNRSREVYAPDTKKSNEDGDAIEVQLLSQNQDTAVQSFTFRELATATKNFRQECLLGEGGSGRVYKGTLGTSGQVVAVKQFDKHGLHGNSEFQSEVSMLSLLRHENLVNLIGYCADGDQRILVYEYMAGGTLEEHLLDFKPGNKPLDWFTRMKIAFGAAKGLEYLHDKTNPPVIYRDLKASNILLDAIMIPKLSDYGLARLGPAGDKSPMSSRLMGTYGYAAPEYQTSGLLTLKSDVYSFGVVFLEIITGRRAIDTTKTVDEQNLVAWAQPMFRDPKKFPDLADRLLEHRFPEKDLNQAVAIAAMCLQEEAAARPLISDVVTILSFLSVEKEIIMPPLVRDEIVYDHDQQELASDHSFNCRNQESSSNEIDDSGLRKSLRESHPNSAEMELHQEEDANSDSGSEDSKSTESDMEFEYSNSHYERQETFRNSSIDRGLSMHAQSSISRDSKRNIPTGQESSWSSHDSDSDVSRRSSILQNSSDSEDNDSISTRHKSKSKDSNGTGSIRREKSMYSIDSDRNLSEIGSRKSYSNSKRHHESSDGESQEESCISNYGSSRRSSHLDHKYRTPLDEEFAYVL